MTRQANVKKIIEVQDSEPSERIGEPVANNKIKEKMSPVERTRLARKAAFIRWGVATSM
jgi:hypothetical protein